MMTNLLTRPCDACGKPIGGDYKHYAKYNTYLCFYCRYVIQTTKKDFPAKCPICARPRTVLAIYDRKHFFVIVDPRKGLFDSPALWSNNKSLLSVVEDYFEILWVTAMQEPKPSKSV